MISHAEVNERCNRLFAAGMRGEALATRMETIRQFQRLGLGAEAVDHLLLAVPVRERVVRRAA